MKAIKKIISIAASVYLTTLILPNLSFGLDLKVLLITSVFLFFADLTIKPLLKLLLLPLNLITLGSFRWLVSAIIIYLVIYLIQGLTIANYYFPGILGLPAHQFGAIISVIIASLVYNLCLSIIGKILN